MMKTTVRGVSGITLVTTMSESAHLMKSKEAKRLCYFMNNFHLFPYQQLEYDQL